MVISFFIRLHHLRETGRCPPGLVITITKAQDEARRALYTAAFQEPELPELALAQMVHALCESLLCARTSSLEKIFGPIEFTFCLYMQRPDGRYRTANNLTQFLAAMQWCLRNILGHIIRLQDSSLPSYALYHVPVAPPSPLGSTSPGSGVSPFISVEKVQDLICTTEGTPPEDTLNCSTLDKWAENGSQMEDDPDSDNPLDELDDSEDEDYPVDEGSGDIIVRENTTLYLHSTTQDDGRIIALDPGSKVLEADKVIPQGPGGLLQYVSLNYHRSSMLS